MYNTNLVDALGGKDHLQKIIKANNFISGRVFTHEKILLAFSFHGNKKVNFVCISNSERKCYTLTFYKVNMFKHKETATKEGITAAKLAEVFKSVTGLEIDP